MDFTGNSKNLADIDCGSLVPQNQLTCLSEASDRVVAVTQRNGVYTELFSSTND
jgi:hypothetical protein